MKHIIITAMLTTFLLGCMEDEDERFDVGYSDGYAVGYNTECKIRATLIEGDWDSDHYTRGYNTGLRDGSKACRADQQLNVFKVSLAFHYF